MTKPALTLSRCFCVLIALLLLSGCAARQNYKAGEELMAEGHYDAAVQKYFAAASKDPEADEYRVKLANASSKAAWQHLQAARDLAAKKEFEPAAAEFRLAIGFDPTLEIAHQELKGVEERIQAGVLIDEAEEFYRQRRYAQAKTDLQQALILDAENARAKALLKKIQVEAGTLLDGQELDIASTKPITLKFKDAQIKEVFRILSQLSGINFIFDEDTKDQRVTVFLEDATFAQALELLLKMNNLGERVLNPKTVIIYSDTRDKEKQYQDQLIQIFYLSNIDAKKAVNLLRTMLQLRKIYVHEELNAIVIRDTPDVIRLAQQILEAADRADAEVLYDLELVEINHSDDMNIGPRLSTYGTSFGYVPPGTTSIPDTVTVEGLSNLQFLYTIPTATFQLEKTLKDSEILANPKIRVKNKAKAKVHIGSREPVITVTTTGTTGITSDSIQYVDVGVKLEVEPVVQLDNTVDTKISLEVSNVTGRNTTDNGTLALTLSTTNASTDLTLKDGETTILGGLIRDDYTKTKNTFPILGKIPLLGDLISGHLRNKSKREILLSITPHIVRSVDLPKANVASIWSGGEDDLKAGPNFSAFAAPLQAEQSRPAPPPVPGRSTQSATMTVPAQAEPAEIAPETMPESAAPATLAPQGLPQNGPPPALPAPDAGQLSPAPPPPSPEASSPEALAPVAAPASAGAPAMPGMAEAPPSGASVATVAMPRQEALAAPDQARVFLRGPTLVKAGEEFVVEVDVDNLHDLYSAPFFLNFPPQLCVFTRVEEGGFLGSGGQPTIFTSSANQKNGQLIIGTKQGNNGSGASGSGTLARVVFTAKTPGSGDLSLDRINFRDPSGGRLPVAAEGLRIEVR